MKKVTTAVIAIAIALVLIISGKLYFGHSGMSHMYSILKNVDTPDGAIRGYLEMMIPHHAEAVNASKQVMMDKDITDPQIRLFAARVADAQEFEISQMEGWYRDWFGMDYATSTNYMPMMSDLTNLVGDKKAKAYLEEMIAHHEEAIDSSRQTREFIESIQAKNSKTDGDITVTNSHIGIDTSLVFTKHVEDVQAKEIAEMKELLKNL
ncbi:MAG: DUF305 domain-containing protein [Patescibacteria group bacterium]